MLETIWFVLWGVLWAVYFTLDGFDLGLGTLNPFIARSEEDKRVAYNSMGPFWDGNEVWLISAGGVTFAAFPTTYAVMFSTLYSPLLLILFALILRAAAFEFRGKHHGAGWKLVWDICHFVGSFLPALLFGVAFANIFQGLPLDEEGLLQGNILTLLNPYGLLGGVTFVMLFLVHGAIWLAVKAEQPLEGRAGAVASKLWVVLFVVLLVFLVATRAVTPLFDNYLNYPLLLVIPVLALVALLAARFFILQKAWWKAWFASGATILFTVLFGVIGLYPNLLPSSIDPRYGLTAFNSSSSPLTLKIMLATALIFVPIVIAYQAWGYYILRDKITKEDLASDEAY
jgi:cytochrome bd ubiquinol oxidase subunit II